MAANLTQKRHQWLNLVQTWLLAGGALVLLGACAYMFFGLTGLVWAAVFGGIGLMSAARVSPAMVLRLYRAQPLAPGAYPLGQALLAELSERAGLGAVPRLCVLPSRMMNAFAVGRRTDSAICVTDRLVRSLNARELSAVLAHEVTHIRNEDLRVMALADIVSRLTSVLSMAGLLTLFINLPMMMAGAAEPFPWAGVLLLVAAPTLVGLLQLALSRTREHDADLGAVLLTGDPDALASALMKLDAAQGRHWEGMVLPGARIPDPSLLRTHPPVADRLARLRALKEAGVGAELPALEALGAPPPPPRRRRLPLPPLPWLRADGFGFARMIEALERSGRVEPLGSLGDEALLSSGPAGLPGEVAGMPRMRLSGVWW